MKICGICGSSISQSSNEKVLGAIGALLDTPLALQLVPILDLPLYKVHLDANPIPQAVAAYRQIFTKFDAVIICTPEYIHNIPAVLKNALEWLTTSGELYNKRVLPITYTPHPPRGDKAMTSLNHSLQALNTNIVASLNLYHSDIHMQDDSVSLTKECEEMVREAIKLLVKQ